MASEVLLTSESYGTEEFSEELDVLVEKLARLNELKSQREEELESTRARFASRCNILEEQIAKISADVQEFSNELELQATTMSESKDFEEEAPPGPRCLWWVDGQPFGFIVSFVVSINIVVMVVQKDIIFHEAKQMKGLLHWANHGFLIFYLVEMCLKLVVWRGQVFIGRPCERIWSNWLDAFIIVMAIIDQWIVPLVVHDNHKGTGLGALRILRLARLLRCCKFLGTFLHADLQWAEGEEFTLFIMSVIGLSCILMGVESDFPTWGGWIYIENLFLIIFLFELAMRLRFRRWSFFISSDWIFNWLDFLIVLGGILNMWALPCVSLISSFMGRDFDASTDFSDVMKILRMVRLIRLLRLVRLVRSCPPLFILRAMQSMLWIGLLALVVIYLLALLCIKLAGPRGLLMGSSVPDEVRSVFPTIGRSMWLLFLAMNGWTGHVLPVFEYFPAGLVLLVAYMIFSGFVVKSVLTAVISDGMANVSEEAAAQEIAEEQTKHNRNMRHRLEEMYDIVDTNANGSIDRDEFNRLIQDEDRSDDLSDLVNMEKTELPMLWFVLAKGERVIEQGGQRMEVESILREDFIEGLFSKQFALKEFSMLKLEKRMAVLERLMFRILTALNSDDGPAQLSSFDRMSSQLISARAFSDRCA